MLSLLLAGRSALAGLPSPRLCLSIRTTASLGDAELELWPGAVKESSVDRSPCATPGRVGF
jgi:hypothetical protein